MKPSTIAFLSLTKKEVRRTFRIRKQTILPAVVTTSLYFLIFWTFIGSQIPNISWIPYIQFLVPGFIMMSVITASYANVSSSFFWAKFQKSIEEILVSPMSNTSIIIAFMMWWVIRWIIIALLIFWIAHIFTDISISHPIITLLFLFFSSSLFSLAWFFNAFFAKSFDDVNIIPTFIITPLVYLGWVFYPLAWLSWFWQFFTQMNPIFYMVNGLRYGILWISEVNAFISLWVIILFNIIFFILNLKMFAQWYGLKN